MNIAVNEADFGTRTAPDTVRVERLLPGPIGRVWDYLTDATLRAQWLAGGALEPRVGGRVELVFNNSTLTEHDDPPPAKYAQYAGESRMAGTITEFDPPYLLAYTWGEADGEHSHVRFELATQGPQVRLVVTHSRLATREGLLVGISSGANVLAACDVATELGPGKNVVTVLCDTGERYFSLGEYFR